MNTIDRSRQRSQLHYPTTLPVTTVASNILGKTRRSIHLFRLSVTVRLFLFLLFHRLNLSCVSSCVCQSLFAYYRKNTSTRHTPELSLLSPKHDSLGGEMTADFFFFFRNENT